MHEKKFNPEMRHKLNQSDRLEWFPPHKIWEFMGNPQPRRIVDIGAGTGFITKAFATERPSAKTLALDIEPLMVEEMQQSLDDSPNICPVLMAPDKLPVPDQSIDVVWMVNLFHELDEPHTLLAEIRRSLAPEGRLLIIDWDSDAGSFEQGPPQGHRLSMQAIHDTLETAEFKVIATQKFHNHNGLVATNKA